MLIVVEFCFLRGRCHCDFFILGFLDLCGSSKACYFVHSCGVFQFSATMSNKTLRIESLLGMLTVKLQDDNFVKWSF